MKHYHFHLFDGHVYTWDGAGMTLPDLGAVVVEAERRARSVMSTCPDIEDWSGWFIDVRGHDDITMFRFPFSEIAAAS